MADVEELGAVVYDQPHLRTRIESHLTYAYGGVHPIAAMLKPIIARYLNYPADYWPWPPCFTFACFARQDIVYQLRREIVVYVDIEQYADL